LRHSIGISILGQSTIEINKAKREMYQTSCEMDENKNNDVSLEVSNVPSLPVKRKNVVRVDNLLKVAESGNPKVQLRMGLRYSNGRGGVEQDYDKAAYWYALAAKQDNGWGQLNLASCLRSKAHYHPEIRKQYTRLLRQAATGGNAEAQFDLALLYWQDKLNDTPEKEKARYWFRKAAAQGHFTAIGVYNHNFKGEK